LGHSISVGKDVIVGMGKDYFLTQELVNRLNQRNIHLLFQASQMSTRGTIGQSWISSVELGLEEDLAVEWDNFRHNLIDSCIFLVDRPDELIWT
jgi:hypothetical protein